MFKLIGARKNIIFFQNSIAGNIFKLYFSNNNLNEINNTINDKGLSLRNEKLQQFLESLRREFYNEQRGNFINHETNSNQRFQQLSEIVKLLEQYRTLEGHLTLTRNEIAKEKDDELKELIAEEEQVYSELIGKAERELLEQLPLLVDSNYYPSLIFEINAGAGGQEAMLFARDLLKMYQGYFLYNDWQYEVMMEDSTEIGGLRHANLLVSNKLAYPNLRFEAGVHRVQRVPATEKSGRIHTSTASVTVIPKPPNVHIQIQEKDLKIETKRASGAGGQHVNTTDSAVRIVHLPTGLAIENQTERSQIKNKEIAIRRLQALLERRELDNIMNNINDTRRAQQGNLNRNEKIRTYNFVQDRITDHRISGCTVHNLKEFFVGGQYFDEFIQRLTAAKRQELFLEMLENWDEKEIAHK